jgi:ABC-type branched-subunit amino acid transport system substrate-binding protein
MRRLRWLAILVAFVLAVAACGRGDDSGKAATTTTAAAASTGSGTASGTGGSGTATATTTTADKCKSEALKATEVGVTDTKITVTVMADVGSPLAPGLFQGNLDALNAYAKYVNANGGIGCRQLEVKTWDSKLDPSESKNGLIDACKNSVAMVGNNALFNPDVSPMKGCVDKAGAATGLPDLAALANDINEQCNSTTYIIQGVSEPCTVLSGARSLKAMVGPTKWYLKTVDPALHGLFMVPGDLPTTVQSATYQITGQTTAGVKFDGTPKVSGRDEQPAYTPRIAAAKAAGATYIYNGSNDKAMWTMRKEAKAQGLTSVKVWACSLACYTKAFLTTGGADVEGTYVWMQFLPFEEADSNAEAKAYVAGVGADKADSFGAQAWQSAALFKQVVDGIVAKSGPNAITRAAILDGLKNTKDFTANGWIGPKDLKGFSSCFVILQVKSGAFVRVYPAEKGKFDCDASNVVASTIDPAEEAKKIT